MPAHEVGQSRRASLVRHHIHLRTCRQGKLFGGQVNRAAGPGCGVIHLLGVCLQVGDELLQAIRRNAGMHNDQQRCIRQQRNGRKILAG